MKVHLIRRETVDAYKKENAQSRVSFDEWLVKLKYADWDEPADMLLSFRSTDLLGKGSNRVVFDIGGNKYRLIGKYAFGDAQKQYFIVSFLKRESKLLPLFVTSPTAAMQQSYNITYQTSYISPILPYFPLHTPFLTFLHIHIHRNH